MKVHVTPCSTRVASVRVILGVACGVLSCGGSVAGSARPEAGGSEASVPDASVVEVGGREASVLVGSDAAACFIEATNYDQSCSVDSDCVGTGNGYSIQSGNYCQPMCIDCGRETINKKSLAQYMADVSKTPLGSGAFPQEAECGCPLILAPCCMGGHCTPGDQCPEIMFVDAGPIGEEDAATVPPGSVMCDLNIGRFEAGVDAGGPWRWCMPPESCVPFNGGWACCTTSPSGGVSTCVAPVGQ
jgi:hypothetical protein